MADFTVPDATSRAIQAYIDRLGPKPGVPAALKSANPWQQRQAMDLAEAEVRENIDGQGHHLPGGVVVETGADRNFPGHTLYGPPPSVYHTYPELVAQLSMDTNAGRKVAVFGGHGGAGGLTTALHGAPMQDFSGQWLPGEPPASLDVFSLSRLLSDLPPHYQQMVLAACNPRTVLGQTDDQFRQMNTQQTLRGFAQKPENVYGPGYDISMPWGVHGPQTVTPHPPAAPGLATPVSPLWNGITMVGPNPGYRSNPDVPILAGDSTRDGGAPLSHDSVYPSSEQYDRAAQVHAWAQAQAPRWIAEDQLAAYQGTLGAPEMQLPHRAQGGPVQAGQPTQVGEDGPELYVPQDHGAPHPVYTYLTALARLTGA